MAGKTGVSQGGKRNQLWKMCGTCNFARTNNVIKLFGTKNCVGSTVHIFPVDLNAQVYKRH